MAVRVRPESAPSFTACTPIAFHESRPRPTKAYRGPPRPIKDPTYERALLHSLHIASLLSRPAMAHQGPPRPFTACRLHSLRLWSNKNHQGPTGPAYKCTLLDSLHTAGLPTRPTRAHRGPTKPIRVQPGSTPPSQSAHHFSSRPVSPCDTLLDHGLLPHAWSTPNFLETRVCFTPHFHVVLHAPSYSTPCCATLWQFPPCTPLAPFTQTCLACLQISRFLH